MGITETLRSGNDTGDKTADHSTLQRLLSVAALCSIDLLSPFYSRFICVISRRATDEALVELDFGSSLKCQ